MDERTIIFKNHSSITADAIAQAWNDQLFTDMIVESRGVIFRCHKLIVSSVISKLANTIKRYSGNEHLVIILDCDPLILQAIFNFVYSGKVNIHSTHLKKFLDEAEALQVKGLCVSSSSSPDVYDAAVTLHQFRNTRQTQSVPETSQSQLINFQAPCRAPVVSSVQSPVVFPRHQYQAVSSRSEPDRASVSPSQGESCTQPGENAVVPERTTTAAAHGYISDDDSDRELQIDEGRDGASPMDYCEERMYVEEDEKPQDLRIESKQAVVPQLRAIQPSTVCNLAPQMETILPNPPQNLHNIVHVKKIPREIMDIFRTKMPVQLISQSSASSSVQQISPIECLSVAIPSTSSHDVQAQVISQSETSTPSAEDATLAEYGTESELAYGSPTRKKKLGMKKNGTKKLLNKKSSSPITGESSKTEKNYTPQDLKDALGRVISGANTPVEVISEYKIPRRTFFRHLLAKRTELGIPTGKKAKSRSGSRSPTNGKSSKKAKSGQVYNEDGSVNNENLHELIEKLSGAAANAVDAQMMNVENTVEQFFKTERPEIKSAPASPDASSVPGSSSMTKE